MAKMNRIRAKGAADRAAITSRSNDEVNQIINDGYKRRQAIKDGTDRRVIDTIREVERYNDAGYGHQVELPASYNHVYADGTGGYVLSNDANYNPNTDPGTNARSWSVLQPAP
ncbi:MAG: hypothetical protein PF961_22500 [Planctomycetota bacterium]|jgi:hypothetical protein|nr:hypothetical protein [Planctomycetota bacterium]